MTVTVTAVSAGAVDYLLRGSGCAEHAHAPSRAELGLDPAARKLEGAQYLLKSAELEPAGVWFGDGLAMVGIAAGTEATVAEVRAVFGKLLHPSSTKENPVFLGRPPRQYKPVDERIAAALAAEPDASEERVAELSNAVRADDRKAVAYYDVTFSPVKSVSLYYAAMVAQGRREEAAAVLEAHRGAVAEAMAYVEAEVAYTRSGYHGKTVDGRSVGVHERGTGLTWIRFDHTTSRAQEPQIHSHVGVLNRLITASDGKIRALDGRGFGPILDGSEARYAAALERLMTAGCTVVFATRADGKAREILGISPQLLASGSTRRSQVVERTERLIGEYVARHGHAPGPTARKALTQQATLETRDRKVHTPPGQQLAAWSATKLGELGVFVTNAADWVDTVARYGHPDQRGHAGRTREQVLQAAVDAVQTKYATWDVGNLERTIQAEIDRTPTAVGDQRDLRGLANEVLRRGAAYGVVGLTAPDPVQVPAALQDGAGKSRYRQHNDERYTTTAQLGTEVAIIARARELTAPMLAGPLLELARVELVAAGLGPDQLAAVLDILGSGRAGDVLVGPAGAGKSRTVGALAGVWQTQVGARVLGLATSQIATTVLASDGLEAVNTTVFVNQFTPDEHGRVADRIRVGDLVVIDEAGMSSTTELDTISRVVAAAGGKVVYTGDHAQLGAVGAGGMLELLVRDTHAAQLTEIHRFTHAWERDASVRLRAGDKTVLEVYAEHGRLRGGTVEEVTAAAVRGYLADTLAGKQSLLLVGTNDEATDVSGQVHAELVRLGRVSPEVLCTDMDGNLIGVGEVIQARRNDRSIRVDGPATVMNRATYEVLGLDRSTGHLRVRGKDGAVAHLPARYVAADVALAYASTVHCAQSLTVDTSHALFDAARTRLRDFYVALTRGREANTAYILSAHAPDHHNVQRLQSTAHAELSKMLDRAAGGDAKVAAELARRAGIEGGRSLASVGTQWDLLTAEYGRDRYTDTLISLLPAGSMDQVAAEPGYERLMRAVREAELAGHDPAAVLHEAVTARSVAGAGSVSDVLRWRIHLHQDARTPEREVRGGDWAGLTAPMDGPVGDYARVLAQAATARQAELGAAAVEQRPGWVLEHLGEPPAEEQQRVEWVRRAGIAAAYRDLRAIPDTSVSLGAAPAREQVFHRVLWQQAYTALGAPADALDYATATDTELRAMREAWRREQTWAPHHVGTELGATRLAVTAYRQDAVVWRAEADLHTPGSPDRERVEAEVAGVEAMAAYYTARGEHLHAIRTAREAWTRDAEPARTRHEEAGDELERRGLPREVSVPVGEQTELFGVVEPGDTDTTEQVQVQAGEPVREQQRPDPHLTSAAADTVAVVRVAPHRDQAGERSAARDAAPGQREHADPGVVAEIAEQLPGRRVRVEDPTRTGVGPQAVITADQVGAQDNQGALFTVAPAVADLAAAQPLRTTPGRAGSDAEQSPVTVGEGRRRAEISAALRAGRETRADSGGSVHDWERGRDETAEGVNAAHLRRDQAEGNGHGLGRSLSRGAGHDSGPELSRGLRR